MIYHTCRYPVPVLPELVMLLVEKTSICASEITYLCDPSKSEMEERDINQVQNIMHGYIHLGIDKMHFSFINKVRRTQILIDSEAHT